MIERFRILGAWLLAIAADAWVWLFEPGPDAVTRADLDRKARAKKYANEVIRRG